MRSEIFQIAFDIYRNQPDVFPDLLLRPGQAHRRDKARAAAESADNGDA